MVLYSVHMRTMLQYFRTPPARAVFSGDVRFCIVCSHEQQHPP
ncbi:MAG: hypothetical protein ACI8TF_001023, partial [Paracoccaceae bacterium]